MAKAVACKHVLLQRVEACSPEYVGSPVSHRVENRPYSELESEVKKSFVALE